MRDDFPAAARDRALTPDGARSKLAKRRSSAALLPPAVMEGDSLLESVYQFDYLGCRITSDGDDTRRTCAIAWPSRLSDYPWREKCLPRSLKMRLLATLNGCNSYSRQATKPSYGLLTAVRTRRHHWLGHNILRLPADRLVRRAVLARANELDHRTNLTAC